MLPPLLGLLKLIAAVAVLLHNTRLLIAFTVAVGLTVMVNVMAVPTQLTPPLVNVGVTVMVAVTGATPVLLEINTGMLPLPFAAKPMDGVLFVQL